MYFASQNFGCSNPVYWHRVLQQGRKGPDHLSNKNCLQRRPGSGRLDQFGLWTIKLGRLRRNMGMVGSRAIHRKCGLIRVSCCRRKITAMVSISQIRAGVLVKKWRGSKRRVKGLRTEHEVLPLANYRYMQIFARTTSEVLRKAQEHDAEKRPSDMCGTIILLEGAA